VRSKWADRVQRGNRSFAKEAAEYVNLGHLSFALREVRDVFGQPRVLGGVVIVALLVGFTGPFGTEVYMALAPRLAYWLGMIVTTYATGLFFSSLVRQTLAPLALPTPWRIGLTALVTSLPVLALVVAFNALFLGLELPAGIALVSSWLTSFVISFGIIILHVLAETGAVSAVSAAGKTETRQPDRDPPQLLKRLPVELRGPLVHMSMQDHYVEVETVRGTTLILLRLADAIRETDGVAGMQIHRSHWVAIDGVARVHRAGGKILIETRSGVRLPVSRTYLSAVREAGLIT